MLFTIAIPAYKSKFLKECINSILLQTYSDFELIIVNDCSPEPIEPIIKQFDDPRITYYKNEVNIGAENLVNNWNNALDKASGEFFMMMGDDDKLETNYLEEFVKLIEKYNTLNVFHCRTKIIDEHSNPIKLTPSCPEFETVYDSIWHRINGFRLQFISDFVYRTSTLKNNGGFYYLPLAWASDDITAYIASIGQGIAHTNLPVFNYRQTQYTISSSGNHELKMKAILMEKDWFDSFLRVPPPNENDKIIYGNLFKLVNNYIKGKKIQTISQSFNVSFLKNLINWYKKRDTYNISSPDIMKATFNTFKKKIFFSKAGQ